MEKAADKDSRSHIGLATEHRLPATFKAKTDDATGTIQIRKENGRSIDVAINSFASVANFLAIFCPNGEPTLEPGHTLKIVDEFNDLSVTITANSLPDAAAAMKAFAVERGKYIPSGHELQTEETEVAQAATVVEVAKEELEKPARKQRDTAKAASASPEKPAKTKSTPLTTPLNLDLNWAKDLPHEYVDLDGSFRLEAKTLSLPKAKSKVTLGISDGSAEIQAFGYVVTDGEEHGGAHLGYIIVEDPKSWIVTGFGDIAPTKHANLNAAAIRIRVTNLPRIRAV